MEQFPKKLLGTPYPRDAAERGLFPMMGHSALSPVIHWKWAREFLARADAATNRRRKLGYLRLAVTNSVHAQRLEAEQEYSVHQGRGRPGSKTRHRASG
jgi:hypothetical protein